LQFLDVLDALRVDSSTVSSTMRAVRPLSAQRPPTGQMLAQAKPGILITHENRQEKPLPPL